MLDSRSIVFHSNNSLAFRDSIIAIKNDEEQKVSEND